MTRLEKIQKEAAKYTAGIEDWQLEADLQDAFIQGAIWADNDPCLATINADSYYAGFMTAVDKAMDWLRVELDKMEEVHYIHVHGFDAERRKEFLERFKEVMLNLNAETGLAKHFADIIEKDAIYKVCKFLEKNIEQYLFVNIDSTAGIRLKDLITDLKNSEP